MKMYKANTPTEAVVMVEMTEREAFLFAMLMGSSKSKNIEKNLGLKSFLTPYAPYIEKPPFNCPDSIKGKVTMSEITEMLKFYQKFKELFKLDIEK